MKPERHVWEEGSTHRAVAGKEYDEVWDYAEQLEATLKLVDDHGLLAVVNKLEAENERLRNDKEAVAKEFGPIGAPEVRRAWAGEMMRQGREVTAEKLSWERLSYQDKRLDEKIASQVVLDFLVWFFAHPHEDAPPSETPLSDVPITP